LLDQARGFVSRIVQSISDRWREGCFYSWLFKAGLSSPVEGSLPGGSFGRWGSAWVALKGRRSISTALMKRGERFLKNLPDLFL
jgi:hypothetical protein